MKFIFLHLMFVMLVSHATAQKITFSELNKKETGNMFFEILGRFGRESLVYKNISKEHYLAKYDQEMKLLTQVPLDFIPEKAFNLDFINYNDFLIGVYQYQKNNIVSCYAFKIGADLMRTNEPLVVDTAKIGFYADNKIYNLSYSENKKQILIYKRTLKGNLFTQVTKTITSDLQITDSSRLQLLINTRRDYFGEPTVDNDGNVLFCHLYERNQKAQSDSMSLYCKPQNHIDYDRHDIDLQRYFIQEPVLKIDQLNRRYLINAFASSSSTAETEGLFTAVLDFAWNTTATKFNIFSEDVRKSLNNRSYNQDENPPLLSRNIVLKKNNGFMIFAESSYTESSRNNGLSNGYYGGYPYGLGNDYYFYDPYSFRYRPWSNNSIYQQTRFHYDNIIVFNLDSSLNVLNKNVINKNQTDVETDNYLSYGNFTGRNEFHFLFLERDRRRDVLSDHALQADGQMKRYPTISSTEANYEFMPKLGKQIGAKQFILPFTYLNRIGFAKIDWP